MQFLWFGLLSLCTITYSEADHENEAHETIPGLWRQEANDNFVGFQHLAGNRSGSDPARRQREALADYFINEGRVQWQDAIVCNTGQN